MFEHSDKLQNLVDDALDKGAEIVTRGSFGHLGDAVAQYFPPTVIVNVNHTMRLMQEEVAKSILPWSNSIDHDYFFLSSNHT